MFFSFCGAMISRMGGEKESELQVNMIIAESQVQPIMHVLKLGIVFMF